MTIVSYKKRDINPDEQFSMLRTHEKNLEMMNLPDSLLIQFNIAK